MCIFFLEKKAFSPLNNTVTRKVSRFSEPPLPHSNKQLFLFQHQGQKVRFWAEHIRYKSAVERTSKQAVWHVGLMLTLYAESYLGLHSAWPAFMTCRPGEKMDVKPEERPECEPAGGPKHCWTLSEPAGLFVSPQQMESVSVRARVPFLTFGWTWKLPGRTPPLLTQASARPKRGADSSISGQQRSLQEF